MQESPSGPPRVTLCRSLPGGAEVAVGPRMPRGAGVAMPRGMPEGSAGEPPAASSCPEGPTTPSDQMRMGQEGVAPGHCRGVRIAFHCYPALLGTGCPEGLAAFPSRSGEADAGGWGGRPRHSKPVGLAKSSLGSQPYAGEQGQGGQRGGEVLGT
jgi:hypothetical protein